MISQRPPARIETRVRVLEHHLDAAAQPSAFRPAPAAVHRHGIDEDLAGRGRNEADHHLGHRRLAGPGLADQRQRFVARDLERHVRDRDDELARQSLQHPRSATGSTRRRCDRDFRLGRGARPSWRALDSRAHRSRRVVRDGRASTRLSRSRAGAIPADERDRAQRHADSADETGSPTEWRSAAASSPGSGRGGRGRHRASGSNP